MYTHWIMQRQSCKTCFIILTSRVCITSLFCLLSLSLKINSLLSPEHTCKDCHVCSMPGSEDGADTLKVCDPAIEQNSLPVSSGSELIYEVWWLSGVTPFLEELIFVLCLGCWAVTGLSAAIWYFQLPAKLLLPWCGLFCVSEWVVSASLICLAH